MRSNLFPVYLTTARDGVRRAAQGVVCARNIGLAPGPGRPDSPTMFRLARLAFLALTLAAPARADDVLVFAAASLKTALDTVVADFTKVTGDRAVVSYAGSSQLARQIAFGAPADVYLSANTEWMDTLDGEGHLVPGTRGDLLGNRLVLVAQGAGAAPVELSARALDTRLGNGHLAMALVEAVPAGVYGKAALSSLGLWDTLGPRVAEADNVRAALALVAAGAAPLGVVYASDAVAETRVSVVATFPEGSHPPIIYPVALVAGQYTPAARGFLAFLHSPAARAAFEAQGFSWLGG